jgi:hypothetical protein
VLFVEGLLLLSDRWHWFAFNERKGWAVLIAVAVVGAAVVAVLFGTVAGLLFRRRVQFSVRALLLTVAAVAIACHWFVTEVKDAERQQEAVEAIGGVGGNVELSRYDNKARTRLAPEWLLNRLGATFFADVEQVGLVDSEGVGAGDDDLRSLKPHFEALPKIKVLSCTGTSIGDAGLEAIPRLDQLEELRLAFTQVTDAGLKVLRGREHLKSLDLHSTAITGTGLRQLSDAAGLRELNLASTRLTEAGMMEVGRLSGLENLSLAWTQVDDSSLRFLENLHELRTLRLGATKITDAGLSHLRGLAHLEELDLSNTKITGAGFAALNRLHLRRVDIYGSPVNDAGLGCFRGQVDLKVLDVAGANITGAGLVHLAGLKQLEILNIDHNRLVDDDLERLTSWQNLRTLCVRQTELSAAALKKLQLRLPGCQIEQ